MPNFDPQYTYGAGAISASGHTGNLTSTTPEEGIYTLYNGTLDSDNIDITSISSDFVMLSENALFTKYSWKSTKIIYDDTLGGTTDAAPSPCGLGIRFKLPCTVSAIRLDFSIFASACRAKKIRRNNASADPQRYQWTEQNALDLYMETYLDGTALGGRKVTFPKSLTMGTTTTAAPFTQGTVNHLTSVEHRTAQQYRCSHVAQDLAAGLHTFEIRVKLESPGRGAFLLTGGSTVGRTLGQFPKSTGFDAVMHQRLTFGAGCITMRAIGLNQP